MAGVPRAPHMPDLPRAKVPNPPEHFTAEEKAAWAQAAAEVEQLGTYADAFYAEFCDMVRLDAACARLDMNNLDTPATRVLSIAQTKRSLFGRNPASRRKTPTSPVMKNDADAEFTDPPLLRVVSGAKRPWEKP